MMRCLNKDQRNLFQQYAKVGEEVKKFIMLDKNLKNENIWKIISKEGVWKLPIVEQYGGKGLGWEDCIIALDGFFSEYFDTDLIIVFISHVSSLYLISKYGTIDIKNSYLSRLAQGEMSCLLFSKHIHSLIAKPFSKNRRNLSCLNMAKIRIHIIKIKSDIHVYISEDHISQIDSPTDKSQAISIRDNVFITKGIEMTVLCDIINFERLFYGIFSASFAKRMSSNVPKSNES